MILVKSKLSEALKKEGVSKNKPDKYFDTAELEIGTFIEMEHTKDKAAAKEIAKDHLCEQKDYYRDKLFAKERTGVIKKHGLKKSLNEPQKKAMKHSNKLGAGAKKRKALKGQDKIAVVMKEFARGTLHSSSGEIVTDKKQALAIAYSEAGKKMKKSLYLRLNKADRPQHKYIKKVGNKYFYTANEIKNFKLTKKADGFFYMDEQKVTNDPEKAKQFEEKVREHKPAGKIVGVGDKVQIKPTAKGSLGRGIVAKVKDISDGIARIVNETGKVFRVPISSLIYAKSKNTLFNVVVRSPLELMKAKYNKKIESVKKE